MLLLCCFIFCFIWFRPSYFFSRLYLYYYCVILILMFDVLCDMLCGASRPLSFVTKCTCVLLVRYLKDRRASASSQSSVESPSEAASRKRRYRWWHQKLADYFQQVRDFERKIQVEGRITVFCTIKFRLLFTQYALC